MSLQTVQYTAGGLSDGTQVTVSTAGTENGVPDTAMSGVSGAGGGAITISTAQALRSPSIKYVQGAGSVAYMQWAYTTASQFVGRVYIYMTAVSTTASWPIVTLVDTTDSNNNSSIRLSGSNGDTPNRLRLATGTNNSLASSSTSQLVPLNQWVRLEWVFDYVSQNNSATMYLGDSTSAQFSVTGTITGSPPVGATSLRLGNNLSSVQIGTFYTDDLKAIAGTTTPIGPAGTPPAAPTVTVWDGSSEVPINSVTVWDGSSEVTTTSLTVN